MIHYIKGKIADRLPGAVAIENNGVAFLVNVPDNSYALLAEENEELILYTHMNVREDDISLYGFTDKASLAMFRLLMGVSGVGAKAALAILSAAPLPAIRQAIIFEEPATIQLANGVGKKIAQRVILELKDKVEKNEYIQATDEISARPQSGEDSSKASAMDALMALGYSKAEAAAALFGIEAESTEEYITKALRNR